MLRQFWRNLPPALRHGLCIGSVGPQHLQGLAGSAAAEGRPDMAAELLLAAWEQTPLDGVAAARVLEAGACSHEPLLALLQAVVTSWRPATEDVRFRELLAAMDHEQAFSLAWQRLDADGHNLFWAAQLQTLGMMLGRGADALERITAMALLQREDLAPLKDLLTATRHFVLEAWEQAEQGFVELASHPAAAGWLTPLERRAEALLQTGRRDAALELWREVLGRRPWHSTLLLRAHAEIAPLPDAGNLPPTAVLVYTWNKAPLLDAALESVAASRGVERIIALDNGSSDATPEVLAAWQKRLGHESMEVHTLPLNVGAPAARNWLAALPALENMDCAAYLDDDALVPEDWLEKLHAARQAWPDAVAWGCCVVDHDASQVVQSADMHLLLESDENGAPQLAFDLQSAYAKPFQVSSLHAQVPQRGQFQYLRPCISVTGCCHLLDVSELQKGGGFDLRFTPSQYDDLERDVRRALQGGFCCYQGQLTVRHCKRSGSTAGLSAPARGNWLANNYKLMNRFEEEQLRELYARQEAMLLQDLEERFGDLEQALGLA